MLVCAPKRLSAYRAYYIAQLFWFFFFSLLRPSYCIRIGSVPCTALCVINLLESNRRTLGAISLQTSIHDIIFPAPCTLVNTSQRSHVACFAFCLVPPIRYLFRLWSARIAILCPYVATELFPTHAAYPRCVDVAQCNHSSPFHTQNAYRSSIDMPNAFATFAAVDNRMLAILFFLYSYACHCCCLIPTVAANSTCFIPVQCRKYAIGSAGKLRQSLP